jgi:hypothetical protein
LPFVFERDTVEGVENEEVEICFVSFETVLFSLFDVAVAVGFSSLIDGSIAASNKSSSNVLKKSLLY